MNAVISGATKGIGRATAIQLAKKGYNLAICARTQADIDALQGVLQGYGIVVFALAIDCSKKDEVLSFCNQVIAKFDTIDILVNNVGVYLPSSLLDEPDEDFEYQQNVNLNAVYYMSKSFGKIMRKQNSGHLFNICSVASKQVVEKAGSYGVTKAAMYSLNNVLRNELAPFNVKVTAILPGATLTASWSGTTIEPDKFVKPEDVATTIYNVLQLSVGANVDEITLKPLNF